MTNQTSFQSLVDQTKKIAAQFPHHYTKQNRMLDTVEEVGELAQAILMVEKIKTSNRAEVKQRSQSANSLTEGLLRPAGRS